jgi:thymidylate synthase (FAD)
LTEAPLTSPTFLDYSTVELIKTNAQDVDVAYAAWVSNFGSKSRYRDTSNIEKLINFLYSNQHMSPFEHGSFTFYVNTTLFVAREFMRHRTFSYNETSGRYKEMEGRFYVPPFGRPLIQVGKPGAYTFIDGTREQYDSMVDIQISAFEHCWEAYQEQLKLGVAKEVARNVLPLSLYTEFYATANPRNVMQFLALRNEDQALYEIRGIAVDIEKHFADTMPLTWKAFDSQRDTWRRIKALLSDYDIDFLEKVAEDY